MSKGAKPLPQGEVRERIKQRIARYDRAPFQDHLATALERGPKPAHWHALAKKNPARWADAVSTLAKVSGFAERSESVHVQLGPQEIAQQLVARHGQQKALELLKAAGLPTSLIETGVTLEHESETAIESPHSETQSA